MVSEEIAKAVDATLAEYGGCCESETSEDNAACACSKPIPGIEIQVDGKSISISGLALIFDHLAKTGLAADDSSGDKLLETVRIYHQIETQDEEHYKSALITAYKDYRRK